MDEIIDKGEIPESWQEALITLLPKQGADPKLIKNYRPISLLNIDYKIFTGVLANRMKIILKRIIRKDQAGFLPERQIKDNTIIDLMEYAKMNLRKK